MIHELVGPAIPKQIPGIRAVHAVDAAGVHPLLLAIGSERYVPYDPDRRPRELLTLANALLGHGQLSLAKYLWIVAGEDDPRLDVRDVAAFLRHALERVDWRRDLHFQTCTTIDTLDYSGGRLNEGSKLVIAAAGPPRRTLPRELDSRFALPESLGFRRPRVVLPGILAVESAAGARCRHSELQAKNLTRVPIEARFFGLEYDLRRILHAFAATAALRSSRWWSWSTTASSPRGRWTTFCGRLLPAAIRRATSTGSARSGRTSIGVAGPAGDRRPSEAAPRPTAGRRARCDPPRRCLGCTRRTAARANLIPWLHAVEPDFSTHTSQFAHISPGHAKSIQSAKSAGRC